MTKLVKHVDDKFSQDAAQVKLHINSIMGSKYVIKSNCSLIIDLRNSKCQWSLKDKINKPLHDKINKPLHEKPCLQGFYQTLHKPGCTASINSNMLDILESRNKCAPLGAPDLHLFFGICKKQVFL